MTKIHKTKSTLVMSVIIMLLLLLPQTAYAADGTDGTEMQVLQPQQLEIQLGSNWAGVEFQSGRQMPACTPAPFRSVRMVFFGWRLAAAPPTP